MYKVWCLEVGGRSYATNALEFETVEDAKAYGNDLYSRWFTLDKWAVVPTSVATNGYLSPDVVESNKVG